MPTTTYTPIASVTLAADTTQVLFSGLPQTFRDLVFVFDGGFTTPGDSIIYFNGDSAGNYSRVYALGDGSSAASGANTVLFSGNWLNFSNTLGNNGILQIFDYSQTNKHKTVLSRSNTPSGGLVLMMGGRWASTAAITSISISVFSGGVLAGSTISIYGIGA